MERSSHPNKFEYLLFFAMFTGPPRFRERDIYASFRGEVDWVVIVNIIVWLLGALWVLWRLNVRVFKKLPLPQFQWTHKLALILIACLSLSIFVSPAPQLTTYRVAQVFIMLLFCIFWIDRFGVDMTLKTLFFSFLLLSLAIAIAAIFAPELVLRKSHELIYQGARLRGDFIANAGAVAAVGLILLLAYPIVENRIIFAFCVLLFLIILITSRTRSAYVGFILFLLLLLLKRPKIYRLKIIRYSLIIMIPLIMFLYAPIVEWITRGHQSLNTLSFRIPLWQYLIQFVTKKSPWIGLGFYTERFFTIPAGLKLSAHNSFIEILAGGGLISFGVFLIIMISLIYVAITLFFAEGNKPAYFAVVSMLFAVLPIGMVSEEMVLAMPIGFTFYILLIMIPMLAAQRKGATNRGLH